MKCIRCKKDMTEGSTDFSLKVMLCSSCAIKVKRVHDRVRSELEVLLTTLDDVMRFALLSGDLPTDTLDSTELLQFTVTMGEKCRQQTRSSKSSEQPVTTADGESGSSKLLAPG